MAARAGAGTAVGKSVFTSNVASTGATKHVTLNNSFRIDVTAAGLVGLSLSGTRAFAPVTQSQWQQLWQDMAQQGSVR